MVDGLLGIRADNATVGSRTRTIRIGERRALRGGAVFDPRPKLREETQGRAPSAAETVADPGNGEVSVEIVHTGQQLRHVVVVVTGSLIRNDLVRLFVIYLGKCLIRI